LGGLEGWREECAGDQDEACEVGADGHSVSVKSVEDLCRGIGYTCLCKTLSTMYR
jgi:hypothetical protein